MAFNLECNRATIAVECTKTTRQLTAGTNASKTLDQVGAQKSTEVLAAAYHPLLKDRLSSILPAQVETAYSARRVGLHIRVRVLSTVIAQRVFSGSHLRQVDRCPLPLVRDHEQPLSSLVVPTAILASTQQRLSTVTQALFASVR